MTNNTNPTYNSRLNGIVQELVRHFVQSAALSMDTEEADALTEGDPQAEAIRRAFAEQGSSSPVVDALWEVIRKVAPEAESPS